MNSELDALYRLRLAKGFREEAEQDFQLQRWRSCVDNAQLSVENSGKAIIALIEPVHKSHNPAIQLRDILKRNLIAESLALELQTLIDAFDEFGFAEHFMTDYGDEENYRDPWSIFDEADGLKSLTTMRACLAFAEKCYRFYYPQPA